MPLIAVALLATIGVMLAQSGEHDGSGRYNAAIMWSMDNANGGNYPMCDNGKNYWLTMVIEWVMQTPHGPIMVHGTDCQLGVISAEKLEELTRQRLKGRGLEMEDTPWDVVQKEQHAILRELAAKILKR